jgi:hypothetical protein
MLNNYWAQSRSTIHIVYRKAYIKIIKGYNINHSCIHFSHNFERYSDENQVCKSNIFQILKINKIKKNEYKMEFFAYSKQD